MTYAQKHNIFWEINFKLFLLHKMQLQSITVPADPKKRSGFKTVPSQMSKNKILTALLTG